MAAQADHGDENSGGGQRRKSDQAPADCIRRGGVSEEGECRAFIEPVRDAQKVGNHGDGVAQRNAAGHPGLGQAVGRMMRPRSAAASAGGAAR